MLRTICSRYSIPGGDGFTQRAGNELVDEILPGNFRREASLRNPFKELVRDLRYRCAGFTAEGDVQLENGWVVSRDFGMWAPGYVSTSHSSQGKTVDRVLIAEPSASFGAASAEQLYVSASRGRKGMRLYVDDKQAFKLAVHRSAERLSATTLMQGDAENAQIRRLHAARRDLVQRQEEATQNHERRWEMVYGR